MWVVAAGIMLLAVAAKAAAGGAFEVWLASTGMFPVWAVPAVARVVVAAEALACVLLVWPRWRHHGWVLTGTLGAAFAVIHVASALLGDVKPCRCFAVQLSRDALWSHVAMTVLCLTLFGMATLGVLRRRTPDGVQGVTVCAS